MSDQNINATEVENTTIEENTTPKAPTAEPNVVHTPSNQHDAVQVQAKTALEDKVKLRIGVVGCGNAGSQIVSKALSEGITDVFIINSSAKDLNDTVVAKEINSYIIGNNAQGAGRDRSYAKRLLLSNGKELFEKNSAFRSLCEDCDVIFVATSVSGGTGSGISPLVAGKLKAMYPTKIIIFYGILPRNNETTIPLFNSVECVKEVTDLGIPYLLADLEYYKDSPNNTAYTKVVEKVVSDMSVIAGKYLDYSSYSMIDESDMKKVIFESGYMTIYSVEKVSQSDLDTETLQSKLIQTMKSSPTTAITRDGLVKKMAVMTNFSSDISDPTLSSNYDELISYMGTPISTFENFAISNGTGFGYIYVIVSGQSVPIVKIEAMSERYRDQIKTQQEAEANKKAISVNANDVDFISNINKATSDIFGGDDLPDDGFFDM